ncbi:MAG TPA: hypothetical protein VGJ63_17975 [Micromonosporaceae bacterium]
MLAQFEQRHRHPATGVQRPARLAHHERLRQPGQDRHGLLRRAGPEDHVAGELHDEPGADRGARRLGGGPVGGDEHGGAAPSRTGGPWRPNGERPAAAPRRRANFPVRPG